MSEDSNSGVLLITGCRDYVQGGRKKTVKEHELIQTCCHTPTRIKELNDIKFRLVSSGCAAVHHIAVSESYECYTWGRNELGQCASPKTMTQKFTPTVPKNLADIKVVAASCGRSHSVILDDNGISYAFGSNKFGQLGIGLINKKIKDKEGDFSVDPKKCAIDTAVFGKVVDVKCGADFTLWLTDKGKVLSAGMPQYGVLGHGTDHEHNTSASSVKIAYESQPVPRVIRAFAEKKIVRIACGSQHSIAVDEDGGVWTWGNGDYGRLGHGVQRHEFTPVKIKMFAERMKCPTEYGVASAGSTWTAVTGPFGQLYIWGKPKLTGDTIMYPQAFMDLSGWNIREMSCGHFINVVAAERSCIAWGTSQGYGELGYGASPPNPKSSANPRKVDALEDKNILKVAAGLISYMVIVDMDAAAAKEEFPEVESLPNGESDVDNGKGGGKRKGAPGGGRGGSKAARGRGSGRGK